MHLTQLIAPQRIAFDVRAASKKRVLEQLSVLLVSDEPSLSQTEVFESLVARERLGSTGLGKGIALPHGRMKGLEHPVIACARLAQAVDFDAPDGQPVDIVCALLVPAESTDEHLQILAGLSEMFSDEGLRAQLRAAADPGSLFRVLTDWAQAH